MSDSENQNGKEASTFHPIWARDQEAWFPGDEAASFLIAGQHTWEDIERLLALRGQNKDEYDRKLLLKYVVIELRSLIQIMDALHAKVMSADVYETGQTPLYRGISSEERSTARSLWTEYSKAKKAVEDDLITMRNKIGAHRDVSDWQLVMSLWDKLDVALISNLLKSIPPTFNYAKELNIYEWSRSFDSGVIEILGGPVGPWIFEEDVS